MSGHETRNLHKKLITFCNQLYILRCYRCYYLHGSVTASCCKLHMLLYRFSLKLSRPRIGSFPELK